MQTDERVTDLAAWLTPTAGTSSPCTMHRCCTCGRYVESISVGHRESALGGYATTGRCGSCDRRVNVICLPEY
jgi:hypothetical protein